MDQSIQSDDSTREGDAFDALLQRALAGDQQAVAEVVESLRPFLLLIANQDLDRDLQRQLGASDLVQSAIIAAHENFGHFRGSSSEELQRWVRKILKNNLIDARRRYKGAARRHVSAGKALLHPSTDTDQWAVSMETPRRGLVRMEQNQRLEEALNELPDQYRQVIQLRNWQGLGFRDIGQQMAMGEDAARKLWSRALVHLQRLIQNHYPELNSRES